MKARAGRASHPACLLFPPRISRDGRVLRQVKDAVQFFDPSAVLWAPSTSRILDVVLNPCGGGEDASAGQ